jgi:hypothetical protein
MLPEAQASTKQAGKFKPDRLPDFTAGHRNGQIRA